jgi:hypothetical protein
LRLVPSIGPWLPWIKGILPHSVLLGGKAAELYYFSILEKPTPSLLVKDTILGMEKGGKAFKAFHDHLSSLGFQRRMVSGSLRSRSIPLYHREDLGFLEIRCPEKATLKNHYSEGLLAIPDPNAKEGRLGGLISRFPMFGPHLVSFGVARGITGRNA